MAERRESERFFTRERIAVLVIMGVFAICSLGIYLYYDQSIKALEQEKQKIIRDL